MSLLETDQQSPEVDQAGKSKLSYKFQRLRERLRTAIVSGELTGKLPGERVLARRYKVNAKTLSKALTDLAAEGLLLRNIGLGTYVKGSPLPRQTQKCLVLHDDEHSAELIKSFACEDVGVAPHRDVSELPPSMLNSHRTIIIVSRRIEDVAINNLLVRGKFVILVDRQLPLYNANAVVVDRVSAVVALVRRMRNAGHRKIRVITTLSTQYAVDEISESVGDGVELSFSSIDGLAGAAADGVTGYVAMSHEAACYVNGFLCGDQANLPAGVSLGGVGLIDEPAHISGQYVSHEQLGTAVRLMVGRTEVHRPATLWLTGEFADRNTMLPAQASVVV